MDPGTQRKTQDVNEIEMQVIGRLAQIRLDGWMDGQRREIDEVRTQAEFM